MAGSGSKCLIENYNEGTNTLTTTRVYAQSSKSRNFKRDRQERIRSDKDGLEGIGKVWKRGDTRSKETYVRWTNAFAGSCRRLTRSTQIFDLESSKSIFLERSLILELDLILEQDFRMKMDGIGSRVIVEYSKWTRG